MNSESRQNDYPGAGQNKLKLDPDNAMIWGVCAGVANYFGFDLNLTRICTAIAAVMFFPTIPIIYCILGWVLEESSTDSKAEPPRDPDLSRRVRSEPHATLRSVRYRFRDLDRRLQRLEKHVTSRKFDLEREIDGLRE